MADAENKLHKKLPASWLQHSLDRFMKYSSRGVSINGDQFPRATTQKVRLSMSGPAYLPRYLPKMESTVGSLSPLPREILLVLDCPTGLPVASNNERRRGLDSLEKLRPGSPEFRARQMMSGVRCTEYPVQYCSYDPIRHASHTARG